MRRIAIIYRAFRKGKDAQNLWLRRTTNHIKPSSWSGWGWFFFLVFVLQFVELLIAKQKRRTSGNEKDDDVGCDSEAVCWVLSIFSNVDFNLEAHVTSSEMKRKEKSFLIQFYKVSGIFEYLKIMNSNKKIFSKRNWLIKEFFVIRKDSRDTNEIQIRWQFICF